MRRELRLIPLGSDDLLVVDWDDETGVIEGLGAEAVVAKVDQYKPGARIPCMPECSGYTLSAEPRKSLADMAVILDTHFRIPDWLMELYPEPDEGDDQDDPGEDDDDLPVTPILH